MKNGNGVCIYLQLDQTIQQDSSPMIFLPFLFISVILFYSGFGAFCANMRNLVPGTW